MEIFRIDRRQARPADRPADFSGTVYMQPLLRTQQADAVELVAVFFEPGARTRPHIHETQQVLHIIEGEGVVATEEEKRMVKAGDIVVIPAHTWHWHGATRHAAMCHLSAKPPGRSHWDAPLRDWETNY